MAALLIGKTTQTIPITTTLLKATTTTDERENAATETNRIVHEILYTPKTEYLINN